MADGLRMRTSKVKSSSHRKRRSRRNRSSRLSGLVEQIQRRRIAQAHSYLLIPEQSCRIIRKSHLSLKMTDSEDPTGSTKTVEWSTESKRYATRIQCLLWFLIVAVFSPQILILGVFSMVWKGSIQQLAWRSPLLVVLLALVFFAIHLICKHMVNTYSKKHSVGQFVRFNSGMFERGSFDLPYPIFLVLTIIGATALGWVGAVAIYLLSKTAHYSLLGMSQAIFASTCVTLVLSYPIFVIVKRVYARSIEKLRT